LIRQWTPGFPIRILIIDVQTYIWISPVRVYIMDHCGSLFVDESVL